MTEINFTSDDTSASIEVESDDAESKVADIKEMLLGGIDGDINYIKLDLSSEGKPEEAAEEPAALPEGETESENLAGNFTPDDDEDREPGHLAPNSSYHVILSEMTRIDEPVTRTEMEHHFEDDIPKGTVSSAMTVLHDRMLVDRELRPGSTGQVGHYRVSEYGMEKLDDLGVITVDEWER